MSSIEQRLVRDIAAVEEAVVVTDSDLRDARAALDDRIESRRQRDRRRGMVWAAAAAVVVLVLGLVALRSLDGDTRSAPPATPHPSTVDIYRDFLVGTEPTKDDLLGVWRVDNGTTLVRFAPEDTVSFDDQGRMFDDPGIQGTYRVEGDRITVSVTGGRDGCAGQELVLRASLPGDGNMRAVHIRPGTGACAPAPSETWVLEHVSPAGPAILGLDNSSATDWQPLPSGTRLVGTWFSEGGGYVLELARNGAYYLVEDSGLVVDQGRWSRRDRRLTLTSSAESNGCVDGARLVLGQIESSNPGTVVVRSTVQQNDCGGDWDTRVWILIPFEGSGTN